MFLRYETVKEPTGTKILVPYCKECKGVSIETIHTCKQCGSHNISHPLNSRLDEDYDAAGIKQEFKEVTIFIYKCDKCGKEYDHRESDNYITYQDGTFETFRLGNDDIYDDDNVMLYRLDEDLCKECKRKVVNKLRLKLADLINQSTVHKVIANFVGGNDVQSS